MSFGQRWNLAAIKPVITVAYIQCAEKQAETECSVNILSWLTPLLRDPFLKGASFLKLDSFSVPTLKQTSKAVPIRLLDTHFCSDCQLRRFDYRLVHISSGEKSGIEAESGCVLTTALQAFIVRIGQSDWSFARGNLQCHPRFGKQTFSAWTQNQLYSLWILSELCITSKWTLQLMYVLECLWIVFEEVRWFGPAKVPWFGSVYWICYSFFLRDECSQAFTLSTMRRRLLSDVIQWHAHDLGLCCSMIGVPLLIMVPAQAQCTVELPVPAKSTVCWIYDLILVVQLKTVAPFQILWEWEALFVKIPEPEQHTHLSLSWSYSRRFMSDLQKTVSWTWSDLKVHKLGGDLEYESQSKLVACGGCHNVHHQHVHVNVWHTQLSNLKKNLFSTGVHCDMCTVIW